MIRFLDLKSIDTLAVNRTRYKLLHLLSGQPQKTAPKLVQAGGRVEQLYDLGCLSSMIQRQLSPTLVVRYDLDSSGYSLISRLQTR